MAGKYRHKIHGFQIRFRVFLEDEVHVRYRYAKSPDLADEMHRAAEILERGCRRGDISPRELELALRHKLITEEEFAKLSGRKVVLRYDLPLVIERWKISSSLANTVYGHKVNLRRVVRLREWLLENPIPKLTVSDIRRYLHDRREGFITFRNRVTKKAKVGVSQKTLANELQLLRQLIDEAMALGMVKSNPAREVNLVVKQKKVRRSLTAEEIPRLLESTGKNSHLCHGYAVQMVAVALYAGLRRSEIRTLRWEDVDFENFGLIIQAKQVPGEEDFEPKGGRARVTTMPAKLAEILDKMERRGPWVFGGESPIVANRFYKTFKTIIERAGLPPDLSLHHSRHTYCSWLLKQSGGDLSYVQEEAGHSDITTTRNYLHSTHSGSPAMSLDFGDHPVSDPPRNVRKTRQGNVREGKAG